MIEVSLVFREKGPGLQCCMEFSSSFSTRHLFYISYRTPGCMLRMKSESLWSGCKFRRVLHLVVSFLSKWELQKDEWNVLRCSSTKINEAKIEKKWIEWGLRAMVSHRLLAIQSWLLSSFTVWSACRSYLPHAPFTRSTKLWGPSLQWVSPSWGFEKDRLRFWPHEAYRLFYVLIVFSCIV